MSGQSYADRHRGACPTPLGRFLQLVDRSAGDNDCWPWVGYLDTQTGYGQFSLFRKHRWAHRVSYQWFKGPIPSGLQIDHLCRNRACVNPAHLEAVTNQENQRRGIRATRTHCACGHAYTESNLILKHFVQKGRPYVGRVCRTCQYEGNNRRRRAKAAAA